MSVNTKVNGEIVRSAGLYSVSKPIGMADIYSTEEKEIGLWIDNKPLYQITKKISQDITLTANTWATTEYSASGIEKILNCELINRAGASLSVSIGISNGYIVLNSPRSVVVLASENWWLSYIFTKTNDTPWSGKFVPQGYGYVSSGDIYSFEERQVGVWTDGKPLYQKSIKLDDVTVPQSGRVLIGLGTYISNIDNIIGGEVIVIEGSTNIVLPSFQIATMSQYGLTYTINKADGIVISRGSDSSAVTRDFIATVKYTKTTDVAGSGEYVPSGDKAVHYSTDEEVIGTFLGETLYRKTIVFSTPLGITYNSITETSIDATNIASIINAIGIHADGTCYGTLLADPTRSNHTILGLQTNRNGANATIEKLILEYTKTS